jgi:hypothetical protein
VSLTQDPCYLAYRGLVNMTITSSIHLVNIHLKCSNISFDLLRGVLLGGKYGLRETVPICICSEHRDNVGILFEANLEKITHFAVHLKDIPSDDTNALSLRAFLNGLCPMLPNLSKLLVELTNDSI